MKLKIGLVVVRSLLLRMPRCWSQSIRLGSEEVDCCQNDNFRLLGLRKERGRSHREQQLHSHCVEKGASRPQMPLIGPSHWGKLHSKRDKDGTLDPCPLLLKLAVRC